MGRPFHCLTRIAIVRSSGFQKRVVVSPATPKARVVTLIAAYSHVILGAAVGPFDGKGTAEPKLAAELWAKIPPNSVTAIDRNFLDYATLFRFVRDAEERHFLIRAKSNTSMKAVESLGRGDHLVELKINSKRRDEDPSLPKVMRVRCLTYQYNGNDYRLLTSLMDPKRWPARAIIALYHTRWESELSFRELKTYLLERRESLRSKLASGVRQEIWALLIAYNLIRYRMALAAKRLDTEPRNLSFLTSLHFIRGFLTATAWYASPGTLPAQLDGLDAQLEAARLPDRLRQRSYPRWVKVKMSGYARNPGRPLSVTVWLHETTWI